MRIALTVFFVALLTMSASAQTTYTWNQTSAAAFGTAANWTPTRTAPATNDILVFDGSTTPNAVVTGLATQTIGELTIENNAYVTFIASSAATLTVGGGTTALQIGAGSTLLDSANSVITIALPTGSTGDISGTFRERGATAATAHKLTATDASSLTFESGSFCVIDTLSSSNLFGTTALNSVVFKSGSTLIQRSGSNPFGASAPSSVIVLQNGSKFSSQWTGTPSFSGRTYADFELNAPGGAVTVTGGTATSINNLIITAGRLNFNMTGTPGHSIKGSITVNAGDTLDFSPLTAGTVNLNGTSTQIISGGGIIFSGTNSTIRANNSGGVNLGQSMLDSGSVIVDSSLSASVNSFTGPGSFTLSSGAALWLGGPNGVNDVIKTTGANSLSTGGKYYFDGGGPQVTGSLMPDTIAEIKTFTSTGLTLSKTTVANAVTLTGAGNITTGADTLIAPHGVNGSGSGAYVDGNLLYNVTVTGAWIFPVGSGFTSYLPVTLNFSVLTGSGAVVVGAVDSTVTSPSLSLGDSINMLRHYYKVGNAAGITGFTASVILGYTASDAARLGITKDSTLHVYQRNGSNWIDLPVTARDVVNKTITVSGVSSFGTFIVGVPGPKKVTIAEARKDLNSDLIPDHSVTGDTLVIYGIITTPNLQGSTGSSYCIQDSTGGIDVFKSGTPLNFSRGDSVFAIGTVAQYHGLTEFAPLVADSAHFGYLKHNASLPKTKHLTLHQFVQSAETYESQLVEVDSLYKASGTWPGAGSFASIYLVNPNSPGDTLQMYINKTTNVAGWTEPSYPINLVGAVSQYSAGTTVNSGYEIIPRDTLDISKTKFAAKVTIAEARKDLNSDLIPDHSVTGDTLMIYGIVTTPNLQGTTGSSYCIQDSTGGIDVFKSGTPLNFSRGDSVFAIGTVAQYHGLTEFTPLVADSAHFGYLKHGAAVPKPKLLALHAFIQNAETYESQLVEVDTLDKASGTWPATGAFASIYLTNAKSQGDTLQMYINKTTNVAGWTEPLYPINVVGVVSQYSAGTTVNGGYEIIPRDTSDIKHIVIVSVDGKLNGIPDKFYLNQNYPNPFNPSTVIKYGLPKEAFVQIAVYNILGQRVALLVNGNVKAGDHQVVFAADRFATGVYLYIMRADNQIFKQKMLLIK